MKSEKTMAFNPFKERGLPIEKQLRNWSQLNVKPYDKNQVDPYTRCRVILMNGIETEGAIFNHQFAHLRLAGEAMKRYEKRDAEELLPSAFPKPVIFQSTSIMCATSWQSRWTIILSRPEFLPPDKYPRDGHYAAYQSTVNAEEVPSELIIQQHQQKLGGEYRQELQGPHAVERFRLH